MNQEWQTQWSKRMDFIHIKKTIYKKHKYLKTFKLKDVDVGTFKLFSLT